MRPATQSDSAFTAIGMNQITREWRVYLYPKSTPKEAVIDELKDWLREIRLDKISEAHSFYEFNINCKTNKGEN